MDKKTHFYIVMTGTNGRVMTSDNVPLIVNSDVVEDVIERCYDLAEQTDAVTDDFEKISIENFEKLYGDDA